MARAELTERIHDILEDVEEELADAIGRYPAMASAHEGAAVVQEEWEELWEEVKRSPARRQPALMRQEAVQLAAMAIRFIVDCCP